MGRIKNLRLGKRNNLVIAAFVAIFFVQVLYYIGINNPPYETLHIGDASTYVYPELYSQVVLPRVPVYPVLIKFLKLMISDVNISTGIVALQSAIYYVSVIFFYRLCKILWNKEDKISLLCTLCYGCLPGLIWYNKAVRVESLSTSLLVIYLWIVARVSFYSNKNYFHAFLLGALPGILILLRPSFLFLMIIPIIYIIFLMKNKRNLICKLIGGGWIISILILTGQCYKNYQEYRVFALTDISTYNQLVICFDTGLYIDNKDTEIIGEWENEQDVKAIYMKFGEERCKKFIYSTYTNHLPGFILYNFQKLCNIGSTSLFVHGTSYVSEGFYWKDNLWGWICKNLSRLTSCFNFSFLYLLIIFKFFRVKRSKQLFDTILWLILILQFVTGFIGAQNEWARMIVPVLSILIIWLGEVLVYLKLNVIEGIRHQPYL